MLERRYFLVIIDSSGRSVRRLSVSMRKLQVAAVIAGLVLIVSLAVTAHGLSQRQRAAQAEEIARENESLHQIEEQLQARLPEGRLLSLRSELAFAQLWAKSGLGSEPRVLGVGPLEDDPLPGVGAGSLALLARSSASQVLADPPAALPLELERLEGDGRALQTSLGELLEYFHDAAVLLSNTPSTRPVGSGGGFLSSQFGKRHDPMNGGWAVHKGIDLAGTVGMEILAPADGVVIFTGVRGGYGNTVVVDHGYGIQTHYAHLSRIRVRPGDTIRRGDHIADMGSTGRSTGAHLHYEVRRRGVPLNPLRFILD